MQLALEKAAVFALVRRFKMLRAKRWSLRASRPEDGTPDC